MARRRRKTIPVSPIYTFAITWLILSGIFPLYRLWAIILVAGLCSLAAFFAGRISANRTKKKAEDEKKQEAAVSEPIIKQTSAAKKSYGPEIDPIIEEGNRALSEMGRLYMSIKDPEIREKINEIMRVTDKIVQDAIADPTDIPQIKKFLNYYLPTTIKLLNHYDRMSSQGIEGENLDKSMKSINEMLDASIVAFKKHLDSLFANQALDIETDIEVMNTMLAREGLSGEKDFEVRESTN